MSRKVMMITGAGRGIGAATARMAAARGYDLCLTYQIDSTSAEAVQRDCEAAGAKVLLLQGSVEDEAHAIGAFEAVMKHFGRIDVLVNNAGLFIQGTISDEPADNLQKLMEINLYSAYHLTRALLPAMKGQGRGHIFNMCSIASLRAYPHGSSYGITKYAMAGFNANLREEMKPFGIKVTGVFPGATMSDSWEGSGVQPERIMQADDVAKMIVSAAQLSPAAVVEDIIMRPQLGDL